MLQFAALRSFVIVMMILAAGDAAAQRWQAATADCLGTTAQNDVDVADLDGDGLVDLLLANGGDYETPGTPEASRAWLPLAVGLLALRRRVSA